MYQKQFEYVSDEIFYLSDEWIELSNDIKDRDENRCRVCGSSYQLSVHHIIPRKYKHIANFDIDSTENLIALCWEHHQMADRKVDTEGREIG